MHLGTKAVSPFGKTLIKGIVQSVIIYSPSCRLKVVFSFLSTKHCWSFAGKQCCRISQSKSPKACAKLTWKTSFTQCFGLNLDCRLAWSPSHHLNWVCVVRTQVNSMTGLYQTWIMPDEQYVGIYGFFFLFFPFKTGHHSLELSGWFCNTVFLWNSSSVLWTKN